MSWPHILSISRVAAGAPIAALVLAGHGDALLWAAALFGLASLTDLLDGPLARRGRTVGPFGIYLDTTGDKVLVSVVLIALSSARIVDPWMAMIIVGREFLITGVRTLAAVQGFVVPANFAGKVKTTLTLASMFLLLVVASGQEGGVVAQIGHLSAWRSIAWYAMVVSVALTVISGAKYVADGRPLFLPQPRRVSGRADASVRPTTGGIELDRRPRA
jgi:CDP-diacylglycerol---glycerol-3-phosphate 3-phosphatidyltransferase